MQADSVWRWRNTASLEEEKGIWFPERERICAVYRFDGPQPCATGTVRMLIYLSIYWRAGDSTGPNRRSCMSERYYSL